MGSPGAWVLHGNLVWASLGEGGLLGAQALTKVSRVGEQFCAEYTLTGHCPCLLQKGLVSLLSTFAILFSPRGVAFWQLFQRGE